MIATIFAFILAFLAQPYTGTDAGLVTTPAPATGAVAEAPIAEAPTTTDEWGEVPILPEPAYADPDLCVPVPVDVGQISDEALAYLLGAGWAGDPEDGMEALYPPGC